MLIYALFGDVIGCLEGCIYEIIIAGNNISNQYIILFFSALLFIVYSNKHMLWRKYPYIYLYGNIFCFMVICIILYLNWDSVLIIFNIISHYIVKMLGLGQTNSGGSSSGNSGPPGGPPGGPPKKGPSATPQPTQSRKRKRGPYDTSKHTLSQDAALLAHRDRYNARMREITARIRQEDTWIASEDARRNLDDASAAADAARIASNNAILARRVALEAQDAAILASVRAREAMERAERYRNEAEMVVNLARIRQEDAWIASEDARRNLDDAK